MIIFLNISRFENFFFSILWILFIINLIKFINISILFFQITKIQFTFSRFIHEIFINIHKILSIFLLLSLIWINLLLFMLRYYCRFKNFVFVFFLLDFILIIKRLNILILSLSLKLFLIKPIIFYLNLSFTLYFILLIFFIWKIIFIWNLLRFRR